MITAPILLRRGESSHPTEALMRIPYLLGLEFLIIVRNWFHPEPEPNPFVDVDN